MPLTFAPPPDGVPRGTGPRCTACGGDLSAANEPECPQCTRPFDPDDPATYDPRPPRVGWKLWLPIWLPALAGLVFFALAAGTDNYGFVLTIGVPLLLGTALGYGVRGVGLFLLVAVAAVLVVGLVLAGITVSWTGFFCGMMLAAVFVGPVIVGTLVGLLLRVVLKLTSFSQRWYLPFMIGFLFLAGLMEFERRVLDRPLPVETVRTERTIDVERRTVWDSLLFYEEVTHAPPIVARLGLPRPLRTTGAVSGVGEIKVCHYDGGRLVKKIAEYLPGELLAFDVIEQVGIEDSSVRLVGGSFRLEDAGSGRTRIVLETVYEPLLWARPSWRPIELLTSHALHEHVLDGVEIEAAKRARMIRMAERDAP